MKCYFCDETENLTLEHIVPDNIGGAITTKRLCKVHNSFLGSNVDEPFTCLPIIEIATANLEIKSRRGKTPRPIKDGTTEDGNLVLVNKEFKPYYVKTSERIKTSDEEDALEFRIDPSEAGNIPKMVRNDLIKLHKEKYPKMSDDEINSRIDNLLAKIPTELPTKTEDGYLRKTINIDLKDFELEFMKIAYEMACYHFGDQYLDSSTVGTTLKDALLALKASDDITISIEEHTYDFQAEFRSNDRHYIVLFNDLCLVSIFGLQGIVKVTSKEERFFREPKDWTVYKLDPVARTHEKYLFSDHHKTSS